MCTIMLLKRKRNEPNYTGHVVLVGSELVNRYLTMIS